MDIQGTVTIDLSTFQRLLTYREKWDNALKTADFLKELREEISKNGYEINGLELVQKLDFIESKLRRGY